MSVTDQDKFTCDCQFSSDQINNSIKLESLNDRKQTKNELWPEPESLSNDSSKPTTYPIDAFTGRLKKVVKALTYNAQAPLAMAGQCVLGVLSHIGQGHVNSPLGHNMPTSLILITEGESGSGKTRVMNLSHFMIEQYECQQYDKYLQDLEAWEVDKANLKGAELKKYLNTTPKPTNPKTLFNEATIEPILDMFISGQITNASWTTDEAGHFFNGHTMTRDTAGSALSSLTTLYSDGKVSRVRSQKSAFATPHTDAHDVRMTLLLQAQRVVLEPALNDPMMNGQGFLARALIACPEDLRGQRVWNDEQRRQNDPYNDPDLIEFWQRCHNLLNSDPDTRGRPQRTTMRWADAQAERTFYEHAQAIEDRQASGGDLQYLKAYASRMAENASRIASLIAFFEERKTITTDDITRAFMLVEYSTKERLRYLDAMPTGEQNNSEKLSNWLVNKARDKDLHRLNRTYIANNAPNPMRKNTKLLQIELDKLESAKHIRQDMDGRSKVIFINPNLYD